LAETINLYDEAASGCQIKVNGTRKRRRLSTRKPRVGVPEFDYIDLILHRMPFGRFYAGIAAALGYALKASGNVQNLPGGNEASEYVASNQSTVYGSASLDLGVYF
jgi:hypothetical protein